MSDIKREAEIDQWQAEERELDRLEAELDSIILYASKPVEIPAKTKNLSVWIGAVIAAGFVGALIGVVIGIVSK